MIQINAKGEPAAETATSAERGKRMLNLEEYNFAFDHDLSEEAFKEIMGKPINPFDENIEYLTFVSKDGKRKREFAPVKHGHWIKGEKCNPEVASCHDYDWMCSECGHQDMHNENVKVPYCWHCGARMDK